MKEGGKWKKRRGKSKYGKGKKCERMRKGIHMKQRLKKMKHVLEE